VNQASDSVKIFFKTLTGTTGERLFGQNILYREYTKINDILNKE
jgi:hypothetical protein